MIPRTDTAVTNHGYANGRATTIRSVLQAGTAVLVDRYGVPRVKCNCGNPLTPPRTYATPTYVGTRWPRFRPAGITIVQRTTVVINIFVLVDPTTGESFDRPAGTTGIDDTPTDPPPPPSTTSTTASTVPPTTAPTTPPATTPTVTGQQAIDFMLARLGQCSGVVFPFEEHLSDAYSSRPGGAPNTYVVTITGTIAGGGTQVFEWLVDVPANRVTPVNGLAETSAQHCGALSG